MKGLQEARKLAGLTQRQASERLGIPLSTLRRWEQGVNEPDAASINKMADFYKVSTDYILGSGHVKHVDQPSDPDFDRLVRNYRAMGATERTALLAASDALAASAKHNGNASGGGSVHDSAPEGR